STSSFSSSALLLQQFARLSSQLCSPLLAGCVFLPHGVKVGLPLCDATLAVTEGVANGEDAAGHLNKCRVIVELGPIGEIEVGQARLHLIVPILGSETAHCSSSDDPVAHLEEGTRQRPRHAHKLALALEVDPEAGRGQAKPGPASARDHVQRAPLADDRSHHCIP
ncbi:hypothetical protein PMAYCL1PPCAC_08696, partial [Pristionchus mayeri]